MRRIFIVCLVLLMLSGCRPSTTVILPPENQSPTQPTTESTAPPTTVPVTEPTTAPTEETTEPVTEPPTTEAVTTAPPATMPPTTPPAPQKPNVYDIGSHQISRLARSILTELNDHRKAEGLPELSINYSLCGLAAIRAYEFAQAPSHTRPDGRDWSTVLEDYGIPGTPIGENLLYGTSGYSAAEIVDVWMNSPSHRSLVLHRDTWQVGIAIWEQNGLFYAAVLFLE